MKSAKYFRADLALYSVILQKAGIDINLIQNEEQFASLVEKLQQPQSNQSFLNEVPLSEILNFSNKEGMWAPGGWQGRPPPD